MNCQNQTGKGLYNIAVFLFTKIVFIIIIKCICVCAHASGASGSQRTVCWCLLFPSTTWVPDINMRSLGLATNTIIQ